MGKILISIVLSFSCIASAKQFVKGQKVKVINGDWKGYRGTIGGKSPKQPQDTENIYYVHLQDVGAVIIPESKLKTLD